jgi:hypothetical protein
MREQITQKILAQLKSIPALGYVSRDPVLVENLAAPQFPCALIESADETREVIASSSPLYFIAAQITFNITVWTRNPYQDSKRNKLFADIEAALVIDRKLGGVATDLIVREIQIQPQQGSQPYGQSTLKVEVDYSYSN